MLNALLPLNMHWIVYVLTGSVALTLSLLITPLVRYLAWRWRMLDEPKAPRKLHEQTTPLLGGWALTASWLTTLLLVSTAIPFRNPLSFTATTTMIVAIIVVLLIGSLDDRYTLRAPIQLFLLCIPVALLLGADIRVVSVRFFDGSIVTFSLIFSIALTFLWVMTVMVAMKILDGLDGLLSGVGGIAALVIAVVSLLPQLNQGSVALIAVALAGACFGFLFYNWHPASIFLGESGSLLIGFALATLSIIAGTKMVTLLTVLAVPLFDLVWVALRRILFERHSPLNADRGHLHHRLLSLGFTHRQTVIILWLFAALGGVGAVMLQTAQKIVFILLLYALLGLGAFALMVWQVRERSVDKRDA